MNLNALRRKETADIGNLSYRAIGRRYFRLMFSVMIGIYFILGSLIIYYSAGIRLREMDNVMHGYINDAKVNIKQYIDHVKKDMIFVAHRLFTIERIFNPGGAKAEADGTISNDKVYNLLRLSLELIEGSDQARILNKVGRETARVDLRGGKLYITPRNELQDKSKRYYFIEANKVPKNRIYVSPLDLNQELGKIMTPHEPTIRFATPVFNSAGEKEGIFIVNVLARRLFKFSGYKLGLGEENRFIIDHDGYYISNDRYPWKEWGSAKDLNTGHNIRSDYPQLSDKLLNQDRFKIFDPKKREYIYLFKFQVDDSPEGLYYFGIEVPIYVILLKAYGSIVIIMAVGLLLVSLAMTVIISISDRQIYESERENLKLYQGISQSPAVFILTDPDANIEYVNHAFSKATGYEPDEVIGRNPRILRSGLTAAEVYADLWNRLKSGEQWQGELHNRKKSGDLYWESALISPIVDEKGRITNFFKVSEDITERKANEKKLKYLSMFPILNPNIVIQLNKECRVLYTNDYCREFMAKCGILNPIGILPADIKSLLGSFPNEKNPRMSIEVTVSSRTIHYDINSFEDLFYIYGKDITGLKDKERELERTSRAKSEFLANMSHELRTPLNSIIGFSEVLYDQTFGPLSEKQREYINYVLVSGRHLLSLINDVLDLAKVEAGKMRLNLSDVTVKSVLDEACALVKGIAIKKDIALSAEAAHNTGSFKVDERLIKEVILNLLSNAIKFTPAGGHAGIKASNTGSSIKIEVWDDGIGISPDDINKVFETFTRIETSYTRKTEGTGLGLALCKKFVELHGGVIWLKSDGLNRGTTVTFTVPIVPGQGI